MRVKNIADLFDVATVLDSKNLPKSQRLAIVTNAGGPGVMATDALIELGGELANLSDKSLTELNTSLPPYWSKGNPIDILGDADNERYLKAINICLNDSGVDGILIIYTPQGATEPHELAETVVEISKNAWKPILTAWIGGEDIQKARKSLTQNGIPTYETPEDAVKTYLYMYNYFRNLKLLYETPVELSTDVSPAKHNLKALIKRAIAEGRNVLTEEESKRFLMSYGIPTTKPYIEQRR